MKAIHGSNRSLACAALFLVIAVRTIPVRAAFDTIAEHGPSSNRVNAFILGDGYTKADIMAGTYAAHAKSFFDYMFADAKNSDPFYRYRNYFNLYRVNVESKESGATEPQNLIKKDTALGATYQFDGKTNRLLSVDTAKTDAALDAALAGSGKTAQMRFVTVNDSIYGGAGGKYAVYAGGSADAREIALHEIAHSFDNLGDEYWSDGAGAYGGGEPTQGNLTTNKNGDKWKQWIGYDDPTGGKVGAYEGGLYAETGIYRPTEDSKMRTLGTPFNAVSREKIILDVYDIVRPLDAYTSNAAQLVNPLTLTDTRVDTSVIDTQWFVDGLQKTAFDGEDAFTFGNLGLSAGMHTVRLRAFDPTGFDPVNGWVRINTSKLEQIVNWNVMIAVPEPSSVVLGVMAWAVLTARRRFVRKAA